tara:strand:+ start:130 stop:618 length:489 start_codon:yes stop_codon:yes gene_type:complete
VPECSEIGEINQARRLVGGKAVGSRARALFAACTRWAGEWEPSHVAILLRAAAAHNMSTLAALSFGNEINGDKGMEAQLSPRAYARGLRQLAQLVAEIWPAQGPYSTIPRARPQLIAGDGNWNQEWYEQLVRLDVPVVALSYHHYYGQSRMRGLLDRVQSPR